jgi:cell shape-determining protein MreD
MKISVYILTGIALSIIESALLSFFPVEFFKPDLGMPFIIYTTFFLGPMPGFITSIFISLFQEILSNAPHGSIMFTKISLFLIATFLKKNIYIDSKYSFSYICGGSTIIESFLFIALSILSKGETSNIINVLFYTIPNAIFTGFVSIFIFSIIESINIKFLGRE